MTNDMTVTLSELAHVMGTTDEDVVRAWCEKHGKTVIADWRGRPAVTAVDAAALLAAQKV